MAYLMGVDIGTSGVKTVLFDTEGAQIASASAEYPLYQPQNGWAEQDPDDWWEGAAHTIREAIEKAGIDPKAICGVGLSGQMHGLVMLDKSGAPLRRSIIWCDGRTGEECREITRLVGKERLIEITANPALTGFTAGKILWVRKHEPDIYAACRHILLPKDYIRYKLTGAFATEVSDASGMNLLDVPHRRWSQEVLEKLDIDGVLLGKMYESCEVTGEITKEAAMATGLAAGTPVVGGAGDNAAAAVGTGVVSAGKAFTTLGTSGVIFAHSDQVSIDPKGRVHTFCHAVPGAWTLMSCTLSAGLSLKWFKDGFFAAEAQAAAGLGIDVYDILNRQAARAPIGSNRLLFLPYLMGERSPLLDADARGAFIGLSAMHTKYDMLRAVMEGVTFSQRQCLDVLRELGVAPKHMLACGGGARSPFWRQMLADVYGCEVATIASSPESPALGAALLAGTGAGIYKSVPEACAQVIRENAPLPPNGADGPAYAPYYALYCKLYPALQESFGALASL
ncbi:MAG: xylulokinase [Christensenellaceae bacterium]|jgi:xylulokinase|nr:xylulokinase [Christensenellaceae bacterium]